MAILCAFLVVVQSGFIYSMRLMPEASGFHRHWLMLLPMIVVCVGVLEIFTGRDAAHRLKYGIAGSRWLPIISAIGEAALPSIGVILFYMSSDWETALRSPPVFGYFIILMIVMLRFDARICLMVGLIEAASCLALLGWSIQRSGTETGGGERLLVFDLGVVLLILLATLVSMHVAQQARRLVARLIASHQERNRTSRALALTTDAHRKAEAVIWQKDRLLSILGHDLRSPLNGMAGLSELMARTPDNFTAEEIRRYAQEIHQTSRHLRELVDNLMTWAQVRTGQMPCEPQAYPLARLIEATGTLFDPILRAKQITLSSAIPAELSVIVDRQLFQTILRNLLSNAIKFTPRNGAIKIVADADQSRGSIVILDSGAGFPAGLPEQLAEGVALSSTPGTESETGTGIGLLLCQEIIRVIGGTMEVRNEPGQGGAVRLQVPLHFSTKTRAEEIANSVARF